MQLPSIDRTPNVRPAGADLASSGANRVIPVAPVNPSVSPSPPVEPTPGVIDMVNPALKPQEAGGPYSSVPDPISRSAEAVVNQKDWTLHRATPQKVEDPPPKPIAQVLMDHLKTVWTASASAIQIEQVKDQLTPPQPLAPTDAPGQLAKEVLVYAPSKIKKNENI